MLGNKNKNKKKSSDNVIKECFCSTEIPSDSDPFKNTKLPIRGINTITNGNVLPFPSVFFYPCVTHLVLFGCCQDGYNAYQKRKNSQPIETVGQDDAGSYEPPAFTPAPRRSRMD